MKRHLVREADRVFSLFVRNRGSTFDYNHCYTCGIYLPIEELQAGHFRRRGYTGARWHPLNVWPQCGECNVDKGGNLKKYKKKLIAQFGQDAVDGLYILSRSANSVTDDELRAIIKRYK